MKKYSIVGFILAFVLVIFLPKNAEAEPLPFERVQGQSRYHTAIEISKKGWPSGLDSSEKAVILARSDNPADALAAAGLAGVKDAPILLTSPAKLEPIVITELNRLQAKKVYVLGGTSAVSEKVVSDLKEAGKQVLRISGSNRYQTAEKINEAAGLTANPKAIVVNGVTVADALSASTNAALNGIPIYLATKNSIPTALPSHIKEVILYGGEAAISKSVEVEIAKTKKVTRISGSNRYDTNIEAIHSLSNSFENIILVRGQSTSTQTEDYPDAVAASGLAKKLQAPIVLTPPDTVNSKVEAYIAKLNKHVYVLGGVQAVSERLVNAYQPLFEFTGLDPSLESNLRYSLNKPNGSITNKDLQALITLSMNSNGIESLEGLQYAINLKELNVSYNPISDVTPISGLTELTKLYLGNNYYLRDFRPLNSLTKLQTLTLDSTNINDLASIGKLTKLETLDLSNTLLTSLNGLQGLNSLTTLNASNNELYDLSPLKNLKKVKNLYLQENFISDIRPIGYMSSLVDIDLSQNDISDLTPFKQNTNLKYVNLEANNIKDISALTSLNLIRIIVSHNQIRTIEPIITAVKNGKIKSLLYFKIDYNKIDLSKPENDLTVFNREVTVISYPQYP